MKATSTKAVEKIVDETPIELTIEMQERLKNDLATCVHSGDTLGRRYGMGGEAGLRRYLVDHPWLVTEAKKLKALMDSDQSTAERIKLKSQIAYEETIPSIASIANDSKAAAKDRIEAAKELRTSGAIGVTKDGAPAAGTQFNLVINMPDHREVITTTVVSQPPPEDESAQIEAHP